MEQGMNEKQIREMLDKMTPEQKNEMLFMNVVLMFQMSAMAQLGKVPNPETHKIEKNLDAAKSTIDLLIMLQSKTRNNLSAHEQNMLDGAIRELQMAFVQETKSYS